MRLHVRRSTTCAVAAFAAALSFAAPPAQAGPPAPPGATWLRSMRLDVSNFDKSVAFYRDVVGIKLVAVNGGGATKMAVFTPSGKMSNDESMFVLGYDPKRTKPIDPTTLGWVSFGVTDVDAAVARTKAAGYKVLMEPMVAHEGRTRGAVIQDPDGVRVELMGFLREARPGDENPKS